MANQQIREVYTRTYSVTRSRKALLPYQTLKLLNVLPVELKCLDSPIQCISELIIALVGGWFYSIEEFNEAIQFISLFMPMLCGYL